MSDVYVENTPLLLFMASSVFHKTSVAFLLSEMRPLGLHSKDTFPSQLWVLIDALNIHNLVEN